MENTDPLAWKTDASRDPVVLDTYDNEHVVIESSDISVRNHNTTTTTRISSIIHLFSFQNDRAIISDS